MSGPARQSPRRNKSAEVAEFRRVNSGQSRFSAFLCVLCVFISLPRCASGKYNVADENFFADGYALEKNVLQFVETADNNSVSEPAAERFRKNCAEAENKAKARFHAAHPLSKDEGKRLGEYFEKNGACRVRIAFRVS